jgi:hypothetical protein
MSSTTLLLGSNMQSAYAKSDDDSNLPQKDGESINVENSRDIENMGNPEFEEIEPVDVDELEDTAKEAPDEIEVPEEVQDLFKEIKDKDRPIDEDVRNIIEQELEGSELDMSVNSFIEEKSKAIVDISEELETNGDGDTIDGVASLSGVAFDAFDGPSRAECVDYHRSPPATYSPPDPTIGVGQNHVIVMENKCGAIYDSSTGDLVQGPFDLHVFFLPAGEEENEISAPFIVYDEPSGRFFITITDVTDGVVRLAISNEDDRIDRGGVLDAAGFNVWSIRFRSGGDPGDLYLDRPSFAVSSDKVAITGNLLTAGDKVFKGSQSAFLDKNCYLNPPAAGCGFFYKRNTAVFSPHAVVTTGTDEDITIISSTPTYTDRRAVQNMLYLESWTGPANDPVDKAFHVKMKPTGVPQGAPQPALRPNSILPYYVETGDNRIQSAYETPNHNFIWLTFNDACYIERGAEPGGERFESDCIRLIQLEKSKLELVQDFNVGLGTFYGALTVDDQGTLYVIFGLTSTGEFPFEGIPTYPSLQVSRQLAGAKIRTLEGVLFLEGDSFTTDTRWGDYFGAAPDPDGTGAWLHGEYQTGHPLNWGTKIAHVN